MKNSRKAVLLVSLLALFANAQEAPSPLTDEEKNLRMVAYLHPFPLFFGAAYNMLMFSSTVEMPMNLGNSVIIQPVVWLGSSDGYIPDFNVFNFLADDGQNKLKYENLIRIGSGIGLRHYILNRGVGIYLQAIASAYYFSAKSISYREKDDNYSYLPSETWTNVNGAVGEFMLYTGLTRRWENMSLLFEVGLGFGYDGTGTKQMGYINRLATNFNFNIGIPF